MVDPLDALLDDSTDTANDEQAAGAAANPVPDSTPAARNTITHPFTGLEIDLDNTDQVLAAFELAKHQKDDIGQFHSALSEEIAKRVDADGAKTQRVMGTHITAKVTLGERLPSSSGLKELYRDTPAEIRDQYLSIASVSVKKREADKLRRAKVAKENELLARFQQRIEGCYEAGYDKAPYVTIEKGSDD